MSMGFVALLMAISQVFAANVHSIKNGSWGDQALWSNGSVPAHTDQVTISHRVFHNSTLVISSSGSVTVENGGYLSVKNDIDNNGFFVANDSVVAGGVRNTGSFENNAYIHFNGRLDNYVAGVFSNHGTIQLEGNLINRGTFYTTGAVYMQGNFDNQGSTVSPSGSYGYFEVCGNAYHRSGASVSGANIICLQCGGNYTLEPGAIGDFLIQCAPLAVILSDLKTEIVEESAVQISWSTHSESNSDWFVVERSVETNGVLCKIGICGQAREFVELGRVSASGTTSSETHYQFKDEHPLQGLNYYRLRMIDKNGVERYSAVVDAVIEGLGVKLLAYPNPNNSVLHIQALGIPGQNALISLYSIDGKRVWERNIEMGNGPFRYDMQGCDFAAGVYILVLRQGSAKESRKLVFEK